MRTRAALKMILACLLVSLGVSGCVLGGSGASLTSKENRQLALDLQESARELAVVNWYGAKGAKFKYEEIVDGGTGLIGIVKDGRRSGLSRLEIMEARWSGIDWIGADRELGEVFDDYFRASRSFYDGLGPALDYFDEVSTLLERESNARDAFYVAPATGDEAAIGDVYRQTLTDVIDEMRAVEAPTLLEELHRTETAWLKARLDYLDRSRVAGKRGDSEEVSRLVDEKAAEWTAFREAFEKLEYKVAEESEAARGAGEVERLLGKLQRTIAGKQ